MTPLESIAIITKKGHRTMVLERVLELLRSKPKIKWIQVEVSSYCPFRCIYCPSTVYKDWWDSRFISLKDFKKLESFFPYSELIYLQGWGEPLLNPEFFDFVKVVKRYGKAVGTTTSGMFLDEECARKIVEEGVDIISFSLAGTSFKVNNFIRFGTSLHKVLKSIETIGNIKEKRGFKTPYVHISYMLLKSFEAELARLPKLCYNVGVDQVVVNTLSMVTDPNLKKEAFFLDDPGNASKEIVEIVEKYLKEPLKKLPLRVMVETKALENKPFRCPEMAHNSFFVGVRGDVSSCVYLCLPTFEVPRGFNFLRFGSIHASSIERIWFSKAYESFRKAFLSGGVPSFCSNCLRLDTIYFEVSKE